MDGLQWLDFDYSEGDDEVGVFDALASVLPEHADAVRAEIDAVLAWAEAERGRRAPAEEGGDWDAELQLGEDAGPPARLEFGLTISGTPAFCDAFRERFLPGY